MKNIAKKIIVTFFVMAFVLIPFASYADDSDLTIYKSRYINHSDKDWWDYGIDVIIPGNYTLGFTATNLAEEDSEDNNFEIYCDSTKIVSATKIPWDEENTEQEMSFSVSLSSGKHKISVHSLNEDWDFTYIDFTLETATSSGGNSVPGTLKASDKSGSYGSTFSGDTVYMNAGDFTDYRIAVQKSGTYNFKAVGKFDGTDGNRLVIRLDNAELTTIEYNETSSNYVEVATTFDLPAGTHYFEIYNDDGHYSLSSLEFSLKSEKYITPIKRLTKEQYEKNPSDIEIDVGSDSELSVVEASKRIANGLENTVGFFIRMLMNLIQPIVDLFLGLLKKLLTEQSGLIEKLFNIYIDLVTFWARMVLFELLLVLLRTIDALMNIFNIFAGTKPILVDGNSTIFINMLFEDTTIRRIFWGVFILGIALNLIFAIISVTRAIFTDDREKSIGPMLGRIGKSLATYVMVPILVIVSVNLASAVLLKIDDIMTVNAGGNDLTFGNTLFMIFSFGEETSAYEDCSENPSFTDRARISFYNNNTKYERSADSSEYFYFSYFKVLGGIILCIYIILLLALAIVMFVTRIFDLILLFIASPYFAATISLDGGEKFGDWRKLFIAKLVSGFGLVIMMKLFVGIVLPIITDGSVIFSTNTFINTGFMILLLTAGCYAVFKSHNLLMKLIDPQAALAEMGIAEVAVGAAQEVVNIVKSEASGGASKATPTGSGGGLSIEQKDIISK